MVLAAASPAPTTAEAVARRIEQRHTATGDLTARFIQSYRSGVLGRSVVERGVLYIKRPGRMRWEYKDPEKKLFVSDGRAFYFYVPADRQVVVREQAGERGIPSLLLSGRGEILKEFQVALEDAPSGTHRLRLTPRKPDPEIERVFLEADESYRIRAIDVLDAQGNRSRFEFHDVRENVRLSDKLFRFEIPRGVEVVTG